MTLINASLPLLVGQASVAQHTGHGDLSAAEAHQAVAQAQSLEELIKEREQIQKPPAQEGAAAIHDQNQQQAQAQPRRRRRRTPPTDTAQAVAARAADPLDSRIVDMDI